MPNRFGGAAGLAWPIAAADPAAVAHATRVATKQTRLTGTILCLSADGDEILRAGYGFLL